MKSFSTLIVAGPLLALFWECSAVADYSIDWYVVSGGGGVSTGGVYQVSGTIGQPAADAMSAGRYSLQGGFWGLIAAVQTPGAPLLQISVTASNSVLLQFTAQANAGYVIEYRESLSSGAWQTLVVLDPVPTDHEVAFTDAFVAGRVARFYRVRKS
jgi:hypothetical protein